MNYTPLPILLLSCVFTLRADGRDTAHHYSPISVGDVWMWWLDGGGGDGVMMISRDSESWWSCGN